MSTTSTFLSDQLGTHYKDLDSVTFSDSVDEDNLEKEDWPIPAEGIGIGTLPSGKPFLVCHYGENGAPTPAIEVTELIVFDRIVREPLTDRTPTTNKKDAMAVKPTMQERWVSLRRTEKETTTSRVTDLACICAMLDEKGPEETHHRTFLKA